MERTIGWFIILMTGTMIAMAVDSYIESERKHELRMAGIPIEAKDVPQGGTCGCKGGER